MSEWNFTPRAQKSRIQPASGTRTASERIGGLPPLGPCHLVDHHEISTFFRTFSAIYRVQPHAPVFHVLRSSWGAMSSAPKAERKNMSTAAQIAANTANAQHSTGPRTEPGKAASSRNSVVFGLYSGDFVRPGEEQAAAVLQVALNHELTPVGVLEEILVEEIHRAMWRLRRCGEVESHFAYCLADGDSYILDPMEAINSTHEKIQRSVDRARSQAHRLLHKSTTELRKLQTERHSRNEIIQPGTDLSAFGLADTQSLRKIPISAVKTPDAQQTQPHSPETPRNAPCHCKSGQKYKRCCGKTVPAMLAAA
jgi:hypothetical protein